MSKEGMQSVKMGAAYGDNHIIYIYILSNL